MAKDEVLVPGRSTADAARGAEVKHAALPPLAAATAELRGLARQLGFDPNARPMLPMGALEIDIRGEEDFGAALSPEQRERGSEVAELMDLATDRLNANSSLERGSNSPRGERRLPIDREERILT